MNINIIEHKDVFIYKIISSSAEEIYSCEEFKVHKEKFGSGVIISPPNSSNTKFGFNHKYYVETKNVFYTMVIRSEETKHIEDNIENILEIISLELM